MAVDFFHLPVRFFGRYEFDRYVAEETPQPIPEIFHSCLFGNDVTQHDDTLRHAERNGVDYIFHVVKAAVGFLLLTANHDVYIRSHARRRVSGTHEDLAHSGFRVADTT